MLKVLIVANNKGNKFSPFVIEQVESLRQLGVKIDYFGVSRKGLLGYLRCASEMIAKIEVFKPDLIHAHYGLSGLLANLQRKVPVITTYHGSDIHTGGWLLSLSKICMHLSAYNIFVADYLYTLSNYKKDNYLIQSCGVDLESIAPTDFKEARKSLGWNLKNKYVLFSGRFDNAIKNSLLAKKAINKFEDVKLVELKGFTRKEIGILMSGCDLLLVTSLRESGPLVVKEAMACNRPIVSTSVGDVEWVIGDTLGCYICSYEPRDCANKIKQALMFSENGIATNGRKRIEKLGLDNKIVAHNLIKIYNKVISNNK